MYSHAEYMGLRNTLPRGSSPTTASVRAAPSSPTTASVRAAPSSTTAPSARAAPSSTTTPSGTRATPSLGACGLRTQAPCGASAHRHEDRKQRGSGRHAERPPRPRRAGRGLRRRAARHLR
jgi:hypothetical protein